MGKTVASRWAAQRPEVPWQHVHDIADQGMWRFQRLAMAAFWECRQAVGHQKLRYVLLLKNPHSVEEFMSVPIAALVASLRESLPKELAAVRDQSGRASMTRLGAWFPMRATAAKPLGLGDPVFDATNPEAVRWVEQHAAETITRIADETRKRIREVVERAFVEQFDVDELTAEIEALIGDETRAELIAVTETMRASNEGQQEAWRQAEDQGLLLGNELQIWIVTDDDRLCPVCESIGRLDPVGINEPFVSPLYGTFDGPPAHPRCRCTVGLVLRNS